MHSVLSPASVLEISKLPFFYGREYFVLRSGRAKLILQADRADVGPAFTYLLFDAENAAQTRRKFQAFNFDPESGFVSSALEVILGGFPFTGLGHRTDTRWVLLDGIPQAEATWWAGGVRVTERFWACATDGVFHRTLTLAGADLVGPEDITVRLRVPPGEHARSDQCLLWQGRSAALALAASADYTGQIQVEPGILDIGPIPIRPDENVLLDTRMLVSIPAPAMSDLPDIVATQLALADAAEPARTRAAWAQTSALETDDPILGSIFDHARFGLAGMIAADGSMDAGMFEYGGQWVRDTSNSVLGAVHAGHFEMARSALERMLSRMINAEGATMICNGFDEPDREQFDQMGELLHALKCYRDWSGDDTLIRAHRERLLAMIERPLRPAFRDASGLLHNRRELWERTLEDAYELTSQLYVILGLRDACALAGLLGAEDRVPRWREEADRMERAMLTHPTLALVQDGRLIKRRSVAGSIVDQAPVFTLDPANHIDDPLSTEQLHRLCPDATLALPIALGVVDPRSDIARRTLDALEGIRNTRWTDGGYDRYHTSSQPDQPGPWTFATCFILRAQHDAGLLDRSRRTLEWLNTVQGGRTGAWFEEIPSLRTCSRACGIVPWTSGEVALFAVRHVLGVRFEENRIVLRPNLYPATHQIRADLRFRTSRLRLVVTGSGRIVHATVNSKPAPLRADGALELPADFSGGAVEIQCAEQMPNGAV